VEGLIGDLVKEQAEGMTRRVEVNPHVVLWLEVGQPRSDGQGVSFRLAQVVNPNVQVKHLLLFAGLLRPHGLPIVGL
jgi:hypothetical protein